MAQPSGVPWKSASVASRADGDAIFHEPSPHCHGRPVQVSPGVAEPHGQPAASTRRRCCCSRRVSHLAPIGFREAAGGTRIFCDEQFDRVFVASPARSDQFHIGRAVFHEQIDFLVSKLPGDVVR